MKPTPELGLVIGIVLFTAAVLLVVWAAGDPEPCVSAMCGGGR